MRLMTEFASAVPVIVTDEEPKVELAAGAVMAGALGALVSIENARAVETALVLPAASVAVAVTECEPSGKVCALDHVPEPSAANVSSVVAPSVIAIVALGSLVPEIVTLEVLRLALFAGAVMAGAAGAVASTVNVNEY